MWKHYIIKEERNIIHTVKRRKTDWFGQIWYRNCLLKHVTEGERERILEIEKGSTRSHEDGFFT
jgi:hypothetical protein